MKISVVVPAHNEEENIAGAILSIESSLRLPHELIVVDDHSQDRTAAIVSELLRDYPNLRLAANTGEKGFANAVRFGFAQARGEAVVPVMGDLCDDIATVEKMYARIEQGYDVVCGSRYIKGGARLGGSRIKGFFSGFVGWSLYYLLGIPSHDTANAFKMYRRNVLEAVESRAKGFEMSLELVLKAYYAGFRITEVPTVWREREKGTSSFNMLKLSRNYLKFYSWGVMMRFSPVKKRRGAK